MIYRGLLKDLFEPKASIRETRDDTQSDNIVDSRGILGGGRKVFKCKKKTLDSLSFAYVFIMSLSQFLLSPSILIQYYNKCDNIPYVYSFVKDKDNHKNSLGICMANIALASERLNLYHLFIGVAVLNAFSLELFVGIGFSIKFWLRTKKLFRCPLCVSMHLMEQWNVLVK